MQTLIFLNGKLPDLRIINKFIKKNSYIISADGGTNNLKRMNITPDIIIGDMDSIFKNTLSHFLRSNVKIEKIDEQESTDFEKCLRYCVDRKFRDIIVFGSTSMRPDHTLNNYSVLKKFCNSLEIRLMTDEFEIVFIKKKIEFSYKPNETISLMALPFAESVTSSGLMYELNGDNLEFGVREGTLNKSVSNQITISFTNGHLLLFKKHFL